MSTDALYPFITDGLSQGCGLQHWRKNTDADFDENLVCKEFASPGNFSTPSLRKGEF